MFRLRPRSSFDTFLDSQNYAQVQFEADTFLKAAGSIGVGISIGRTIDQLNFETPTTSGLIGAGTFGLVMAGMTAFGHFHGQAAEARAHETPEEFYALRQAELTGEQPSPPPMS